MVNSSRNPCVWVYTYHTGTIPYRGVPSNCLQKASFLLLFRYKKYAKKAQKRKDDYTTHGTHAIALDAVLGVHGDWRFVASSTLRERREETRVVRGSARRLLFRRRRTDGEERPRTKSARGDDDAAERLLSRLMGEQYGGGRETRAFLLRISSSLSCLILASERELVFLSFSASVLDTKKY